MHLLTIVRENNVNMTARYTVMDTSYIINTMQGKSQEKFTKNNHYLGSKHANKQRWLVIKQSSEDISRGLCLIFSLFMRVQYLHFVGVLPGTAGLEISVIPECGRPCGIILAFDMTALTLFTGIAAIFVGHRIAVQERR